MSDYNKSQFDVWRVDHIYVSREKNVAWVRNRIEEHCPVFLKFIFLFSKLFMNFCVLNLCSSLPAGVQDYFG